MRSSSSRRTDTCAHTSTTRTNTMMSIDPSSRNSTHAHTSFSAPLSSGSSLTHPGAYLTKAVTTESNNSERTTNTTYNVTIPENVRPGQIFSFRVPDRQRTQRVQCPLHTRPGEDLKVSLPPEPMTTTHTPTTRWLLSVAALTAVVTSEKDAVSGGGLGGAVAMTPEIQRVNQLVAAARDNGTTQAVGVRIPPHISSGMRFTFTDKRSGQSFPITCPDTAGPHDWIIVVPTPARVSNDIQEEDPQSQSPTTLDVQIAIPPDVQPGELFYAMIYGRKVSVLCPLDVAAGQKSVLCQLPFRQIVGNIRLAYKSQGAGGWYRTFRLSDMKLQWVRLDQTTSTTCAVAGNNGGNVDRKIIDTTFDFTTSAFVHQLTNFIGNDDRMRTGLLAWVAANEAVVDSRLTMDKNRTLFSCADIVTVQGQPRDKKTAWFHDICSQLTPAWSNGHIHLLFRRDHLILDSVNAVMSLGIEDLRMPWRMEFLGEPGVDIGGVTREWFELVTEQLFDPDFGLWLPSVNNQLCCNINPASGMACPNDHLIYFRFLGRVLGRALFDRQLVRGRMVQAVYKQLLGWPISFIDLQAQDETYYESLKCLNEMNDVSSMSLDFTVIEEIMGLRVEVELVKGGAMREVTNGNLAEYLEANLRYRMLDRTKLQLTELMLGFFDVVPASALTVFDPNELELILSGLSEIDMVDWQVHTNYSGIYQDSGASAKVVEWFWQVVNKDFDQEMKSRLLQFVTGTSGVPSRGFSVLQGIDGNIKKFTIHGVDRSAQGLPRSYTCFNRIDLPNYSTKKELRHQLKTAVTMGAVGFAMR